MENSTSILKFGQTYWYLQDLISDCCGSDIYTEGHELRCGHCGEICGAKQLKNNNKRISIIK